MAVADVFDALVSKRVYKDSFSYDKAFSIIEKDAGSHFDPLVADAFFKARDEVIEVAENNKRLPLPFIIMKFETTAVIEFQDMTNTSRSDLLYREDMLTMKPFSRHTRRIKARCTHRGYYSFTRVNMTTSDILLMRRSPSPSD